MIKVGDTFKAGNEVWTNAFCNQNYMVLAQKDKHDYITIYKNQSYHTSKKTYCRNTRL